MREWGVYFMYFFIRNDSLFDGICLTNVFLMYFIANDENDVLISRFANFLFLGAMSVLPQHVQRTKELQQAHAEIPQL